MQITVKADVKKLTRNLSRIQRRQIPYATQTALNNTAKKLVVAEQKQMQRKLHNPTPQTVKALRILRYAKKTQLSALVGFLPFASEYMQYQVHGGIEPIQKANPVPSSNMRLNKYGNIPGKRKGLAHQKKRFIATTRAGKTAVWERRGKDAKPIIWLNKKDPSYKKRFPFYRIANGLVSNVFPKEFTKTLRRALATAR